MSHNGLNLNAGQVAPCRRCPVGRTGRAGIDWSGGGGGASFIFPIFR